MLKQAKYENMQNEGKYKNYNFTIKKIGERNM